MLHEQTDPADLKKYTIPRGDILTKIKPDSIFFSGPTAKPHRGLST
jgi:hypothetical protein